MPRDEVRVRVRQQHEADLGTHLLRIEEVVTDIALRVDHRSLAASHYEVAQVR
jgi:hypothetical protein